MATAVATAVVRLAAIEVAVEVTTDSMPPMSFWMRDCTSPVRVRVKKAIDCRCRWVKTAGAQLMHDVLTDLGADPGLDDAECRGDGGDRDHRGHQSGQQPQVPLRQGGVDHGAEQERGGQPHQGGGRDDGADDGQLPPVGAEQPSDAAQRHLACLCLFCGGDGGPAAVTTGGISAGVG